MRNVLAKMKEHVGEYKKYQNYLERVIVETGEFQSIAEIFNRYETLIEARSLLSEHQDKNLQTLEETGTDIVNAFTYVTFISFLLAARKGKDATVFSCSTI